MRLTRKDFTSILFLFPPGKIVVERITLTIPCTWTCHVHIYHILIAHRALYTHLFLPWKIREVHWVYEIGCG
jgi:hypothetical protein